MKYVTFFSVLKNNFKCLFCKNKNCPVRYMPERKKTKFYDAIPYVIKCEKEKNSKIFNY